MRRFMLPVAVAALWVTAVTPSLADPPPTTKPNTGLCPEGWTIIPIAAVEDPGLRAEAERLDSLPQFDGIEIELAGFFDGWTCIKFLPSGKIRVANNNRPLD